MPSERFIAGFAETLEFGIRKSTEQAIKAEEAEAEEGIRRGIEERDRLFEMGEQARLNMESAADRLLKVDLKLIEGKFGLMKADILADSRRAVADVRATAAGDKPKTVKQAPTNRTQTADIRKQITFLQRQVLAQIEGFDDEGAEATKDEIARLQAMEDELSADALSFFPVNEFLNLLEGGGEDARILKLLEQL